MPVKKCFALSPTHTNFVCFYNSLYISICHYSGISCAHAPISHFHWQENTLYGLGGAWNWKACSIYAPNSRGRSKSCFLLILPDMLSEAPLLRLCPHFVYVYVYVYVVAFACRSVCILYVCIYIFVHIVFISPVCATVTRLWLRVSLCSSCWRFYQLNYIAAPASVITVPEVPISRDLNALTVS